MAPKPLTAQAVADLVGGRLSGPGEVVLRRVRSLEQAGAGALTMCTGSRYVAAMARTQASAVLVPEELCAAAGPVTRIVVADPARAMLLAATALSPESSRGPGIAATARIGAGTALAPDIMIGEYAIVGADVTIGVRCRVGPHAVIEDGVQLGDDVRIDANVVIYAGSVLGSRVWCKAAAVIGGAGFGFVSSAAGHQRIPHAGGCIVEDDVEVGSHSSIDRGSLDDTVIGRGTKIDNQVQIAHNVHLGRDCLIMAGVGIAGSAVIGDRVIFAGQSGCLGHVTIGDDVRVGAKSAVLGDVAAGATVSGYPARPHRDFLRGVATMYRLGRYGATLEQLARERDDA